MEKYKLEKYREKSTGNIFLSLALGVDTTKCREGTTIIIYCPNDNENAIFVKDVKEFAVQFEIVEDEGE